MKYIKTIVMKLILKESILIKGYLKDTYICGSLFTYRKMIFINLGITKSYKNKMRFQDEVHKNHFYEIN